MKIFTPSCIGNQAGLSLLEVILAIALASMGITVLVGLSNNAITGSNDARSRSVADQYVREGVDLVRSYRDINTFSNATNGLMTYLNECATVNLSGTPSVPTFSNITPAPTTLEKTDNTYLISGTGLYYRIVCITRTAGNPAPQPLTEVQVTVTVAYAFKNSTTPSKTSSATTILSSWK